MNRTMRRFALSPRGRLRQCIALGLSAWVASGASAAPFGSPAWFAQQQASASGAPGTVAPAPGGPVLLPPSVTTPEQARIQASRSIENLNRAAAAIVAAQAAQSAARQLALQGVSTVPNGLAPGGLVVAAGAAEHAADPAVCAATNSCLWQNASLPVQSQADGRSVVTVGQSAKKAILSWDSFNIGRETTLRIDQSAGERSDGGNDWVALNRVSPGASPSQILGRLEAEGSVYLINQNGIVFGGASEVNVHSLIASSLPLYLPRGAQSLRPEDEEAYLRSSNELFLGTGITSIGPGTASGDILGFGAGQAARLSQLGELPGDITVEAGARIRSGELGFTLLAAPELRNAGSIEAPDGQVILAAGIGVSLRDPASGAEYLDPVLAGRVNDDGNRNADVTPRSSLGNEGLVLAPRGDIRMLGFAIAQDGVVAASTSVTRPGNVELRALDQQAGDASPSRTGSLRLGPESLTAVLPDDNDETTLSSPAADALFRRGTVRLSGGAVTLEGGSLVIAPGQDVSISAIGNSTLSFSGLVDGSVAGRLYVDSGATVDVSGIADYRLPMSVHLVDVPRLGLNELADSPVQREGVLRGASIVVDARLSGTREDGVAWVGTPLANVNGYVQQVPRRVGQLLQDGGRINLAGNEVITRSGAQLLLDGGYVHYLGGVLETTRLVASNGAIVDVGEADPQTAYAGIAGVFSTEQPRWNSASTFRDPVLGAAGGVFEPAYIEGGDAGRLSVFGQSAVLLNGGMSARAVAGRRQLASGALPLGGSFVAGSGTLRSQAFPDTSALGAGPSYVLQDAVPTIESLYGDFDAKSSRALSTRSLSDPDNVDRWVPISTRALAAGGFGSLTVQAGGSTDGGEVLVREGQGLDLGRGGSVSLTGSRVRVQADILAAGGSIRIVGTGNTGVVGSSVRPTASSAPPVAGDVLLAPGVTLSTRGLWVNDSGASADALLGPAATNGGSISLETRQAVVFSATSGAACADGAAACTFDTTGSIVLPAGSTVDVSSGGRVLPSGGLASKDGVVQGRGGNLSLLSYAVGDAQFGGSDQLPLPDGVPRSGRIVLEGTVLSHGFSGGGRLSIRALGLRIGEPQASLPRGVLQLAPDWFEGQGFGSYSFIVEYDALIAADSVIRPVQWSFLPDASLLRGLASGADLYAAGGIVGLGPQDAWRRRATDFSIVAGDYLNWRPGSGNLPAFPGVSGALVMERGAAIEADPRAAVLLGSYRQLSVDGRITAHGGSITLTADAAGGGFAQLPGIVTNGSAFASDAKSVWLGAAAELDVSGIVLLDPLAPPATIEGEERGARSGAVLDGGSVIITNDTGHVIALGCEDAGSCDDPAAPGARIDVSGARGTLDLPTGDGAVLAPREVWSDAGSIVLGAAAGLHFRATLLAEGGDAQARGGSLTVAPLSPRIATGSGFEGATGLTVLAATAALPQAALVPGRNFPTASRGQLLFGAELLEGSGIESLYLGADPRLSGTAPPVPVTLGAGVSLALERLISINTSVLAAGPGATTVALSAPYIALHGYVPGGVYTAAAPLPAAPDGVSLLLEAGNIDLGGQFALRGFGTASFRADGDIRLLTPSSYAYAASGENLTETVAVPGLLLTGGDLVFESARLYPATGNRFLISAVTPGATVRFTGNAASADAGTPLSAGGALLVSATNIEQGGTLMAPSGQIVLGVADPQDPATRALFSYPGLNRRGDPANILVPLVATERVRLLDGSLISVSLDGLTVPYGRTVDGQNWRYDGSATSLAGAATSVPDLAAPPAKRITLAGADVLTDEGARIDLSGGGDLQASEWVAGTGGSRDVLGRFNTVYVGGVAQAAPLYADAREVYALVPGFAGPAPYDPAIVAGDPLIGQSVYLSGTNGLPEGVYTLLPARYATLPGAWRLVQDTAALDAVAGTNLQLPDGTRVVAGHFVDALDGSRDARSTRFLLQPGDTWRQYSQYELSSANVFFSADEAAVRVRLPIDAGQLTLAASRSLGLGAQLLTEAGGGGSGALVDIASRRLQIVDADAVALPDHVQLRVSDLLALDAASLLIGGTREREGEADRLTPIARSVVVDNDDELLRAPEILLLAGADAPGDGIRVLAGSRLEASGESAAAAPVRIGRSASPGAAAIAGDGALLRLSAGESVALERENVSAGTPRGRLLIESGASLVADGALLLDASGSTVLAPGATLAAREIDASGDRLSFVGADYAGAVPQGLVIGPATLAQLASADSLRFGSRGDMDFLGTVDIALEGELTLGAARLRSSGGDVSISAAVLGLENTDGGQPGATSPGDARLSLEADRIRLGDGEIRLSGFGELAVDAADGLLLDGQGLLDAGEADVRIRSAALLAGDGADAGLLTRGTLRLDAIGGDPGAAGVGGSVSLTAASVLIDAPVRASGGRVRVSASEGDIRLGSAALIDVSGSSVGFFDTRRAIDGGEILLQAVQGDISLATGAVLDVSADPVGGDAGSITISAPRGDVLIEGELLGTAAPGGEGARLRIDSLGRLDLDGVAARALAGGIDGLIAVRSRSGGLRLGADSVLRAGDVSLLADGGEDADLEILGTIDVSGTEGGSALLAAADELLLGGTILATGSAGEGGRVLLATAGRDSGRTDASLGYRSLGTADTGAIRLQDGARIELGGSAGDGALAFRVPLLSDGEIPLQIDSGARIAGARETLVEAFASWSTRDASTGGLHFDGIVDPAGRFTAAGAAGDNPAHRQFFQQTLTRFVQDPGFAFAERLGGIEGLRIRPGIELLNDDTARLGGDIRVLSDWNLGAGSLGNGGRLALDYRQDGELAPVLTLRAAGDLVFAASLSDGFFQYNNPFDRANPGNVDNSASPTGTDTNPLPMLSAGLALTREGGGFRGVDSSSYRLVAGADSGSADPLAIVPESSGSVFLDGHLSASYRRRNGNTVSVLAPTMIRTGTGSISIAAAGDLQLRDTLAPGVIYTAGRPVDGTTAAPRSQLLEGVGGLPVVLDSGDVLAEDAGDILIRVGRDIVGIQRVIDDGSRTGRRGTNLSQYWWPWMQDECWFSGGCTVPDRSRISFGIFGQGVLSLGGDIDVRAGRDIAQLSVSLPVNWQRSAGVGAAVETFGGGDLQLEAGRDIVSGAIFVADGDARIRAGNDIRAGISAGNGAALGTLFALQDARLAVSAGGGVQIGGVFNPSYLFRDFDGRAYGAGSALAVRAERGDISLGRVSGEFGFGARSGLSPSYVFVLPASLEFAALDGGIRIDTNGELYPAARGQLELLARGDIRLANGTISGTRFGLIDALPSRLPSSEDPQFGLPIASSFIVAGATSSIDLHDPSGLHAGDTEPVRIYSTDGSIVSGQGSGLGAMILDLPKPGLLAAGLDIVDLSLRGQHLYAGDVTRVLAGRDIYNTPLAPQRSVAFIEIGGPGTLMLQAGRDIGPLTSANDALALGYLRPVGAQYPGIRTVGNQNNLWLPREGASILLAFGTAPGQALDAFVAKYIDPAVLHDPLDPTDTLGTPDYGDALLAFIRQLEADRAAREGVDFAPSAIDRTAAWEIFGTLPEPQRLLFAYGVLLDILDRTGLDYNDPDSRFAQQYARGFEAIDTLFPASLGYTLNTRDGTPPSVVPTGTLDMRGSTIQTQRGGDILVLGPGGDVVVGSTSAPPLVPASAFTAGIGPNNQGILVLEQGRIRMFTDQSVLLAQSRIFTEQGGDLLIWSSNGDINAGKGAKTSSEIPPPSFLCDIDHFCVPDAGSQVSGAGIAVLQTLAGQPSGVANLVAPGGTVDAGDAGIRVSGSLNVAALKVANADNIAVSGNASGVPTTVVDTGALGAASSVSASVSQSAVQSGGASRAREEPALMVNVEVLGFGGVPDEDED